MIFFPGCNILDSSLLAYDMVRSFNRKTKGLCVKVVLQRVYDKINVEFIIQITVKMGSPPQFTSLIGWCISTPSFFIIIKGSPQGLITSNWGLRHSDLISPYLFAIAMEFISINLVSGYLKGNLSPSYNMDPVITHLIYVDDLLILSKATTDIANSITRDFDEMKSFAWLIVNTSKIRVFWERCNS